MDGGCSHVSQNRKTRNDSQVDRLPVIVPLWCVQSKLRECADYCRGSPGVSSTFDVRSSKSPHHVVCKKWRPCPPTNVEKCKGNIRGAPYWAGRMNHEPPLPWSAAACAQKEEILAIISMTRCCAYPHYQQNKRPSWVPGILMSSSEGASENKGLIYQSGKRRRRRPPEQTLCKHKPPSLCLLADSADGADASGMLP